MYLLKASLSYRSTQQFLRHVIIIIIVIIVTIIIIK